jgi:hypothetical protein
MKSSSAGFVTGGQRQKKQEVENELVFQAHELFFFLWERQLDGDGKEVQLLRG